MNWRRVLSMKKKYVKRNRSHFWKKRTNSRLNGQRNPTHRSYWIGTVNADWQIAAKVKSASRLVCVCEWKAREIVWMKGQSCVKSFHIFILLPRKGKIKTSFTCYFGDKRQWANHFTNFYRDNDATGGPIRYFFLCLALLGVLPKFHMHSQSLYFRIRPKEFGSSTVA